MTILEAMKQLRDDLKTWCTNNFVNLNNKIDSVAGGSGAGGVGLNILREGEALNKETMIEEAKNGMSLMEHRDFTYSGLLYYEMYLVKWVFTGGYDATCGDETPGIVCCLRADQEFDMDPCGDSCGDYIFMSNITGREAESIRSAWNSRSIN